MSGGGSHTAFNVASIIERLPVKVECLDSWVTSQHSRIVLGTSEGSLLVFDVADNPGGTETFMVNLTETKKKFSPKPIEQLDIIEDLNIAVSLTNGFISVSDLPSWKPRARLAETKQANLYTISYDAEGGSLQLCAAVRRKLVLYDWNFDMGTFEATKELALPDMAKSVAWCGENVCIGFKKEYALINIASGSMSELFPTGVKGGEPSCLVLPTKEVLLGKDNISIFIGHNGKPTRHHGLTWSETPVVCGYAFPYVLAVLGKCVEVRTVDTGNLVQAVNVPKAKLLSCKGSTVYVASPNSVFRLVPVPLRIQVAELVDERQYEEALMLTNMAPEIDAESKKEKLNYIRGLYAYDLFVKGSYDKAMLLFYQLRTEPPQVIGMFPDLLPLEHRLSFAYPFNIPELDGAELDKALEALIQYLPQVRQALDRQADPSEPVKKAESDTGAPPWQDTVVLRQIIDTSLLKAYLQIKPKLVESLLRIPNHCFVEECETVLRKAKRWKELVLLYKSKGLHETALRLLKQLGLESDSPLRGTTHVVQYLQELGKEWVDLVLQYSEWVLKQNPEEGLTIFTEQHDDVTPLPATRVLAHIEKEAPQLTIRYLEHCVFKRKTDEPDFHNRLVIHYMEQAQDTIRRLPSDENARRLQRPSLAADEHGALGDVRRKLVNFLNTSLFYAPEKMLSRFPFDDLLEERAILLSRIEQHEEALTIYARRLRNTTVAEAYCRKNYNPDTENGRDVFLSLLKVYFRPQSGDPMINPALAVLNKYHDMINIPAALELIPPATPIDRLMQFFASVLESNSQKQRNNQVLKNLLKSENLQVREALIKQRSRREVVEDDRMCLVCHKRIGESAFAWFPNGYIVHYKCRGEDLHVCPITGKNFLPDKPAGR